MYTLREEAGHFLKSEFRKAQINFQKQEKIRKKFVSTYPNETIRELKLDDYVIGKGKKNQSFCYKIENQLKEYGDIHGATSHKFGVYFSSSKNKYVTTHIWSNDLNIEEAFFNLKNEIIRLINAGMHKNINIINNIKISPMFKTKILSTYFPEDYICIFSPDHLDHFCRVLGIVSNNKETALEKNLLLVDYKNQNDIFKSWNNFTFQKFLYYWNDPRVLENTYNEEQIENYLNAIDINAGYMYSEKLVKARKANQKIQKKLKEAYNNSCQICGKGFDTKYGDVVVEAHHIEYFSKSSNNDASNIILLCPNHHRIIHKLNPVFDREKLTFIYKNGYKDKIIFNKHLGK